jgi:glyoxylase-like metal-dependent hydrolase (beta-lactamase superfamily II)
MATPLPRSRTARLDVLFTGYAGPGEDGALRVAGTACLVRDGDRVIVVDPGMVPSRAALLDPLTELGVAPGDVTDVVLSHHHPDHTVNIALFGEVPVHDVQAVYQRDTWIRRPAEGVELAPSVRLLATPGHTPQDVTTLVGTADGMVALTHLWWTGQGPAEDPYAPDREVLRAQRERVLAVADRIVPGHGAPFAPGADTPR